MVEKGCRVSHYVQDQRQRRIRSPQTPETLVVMLPVHTIPSCSCIGHPPSYRSNPWHIISLSRVSWTPRFFIMIIPLHCPQPSFLPRCSTSFNPRQDEPQAPRSVSSGAH